MGQELKPLVWIASAKKDLIGMPEYVLHCFQKKSTRGIATPKLDLDLIRERL